MQWMRSHMSILWRKDGMEIFMSVILKEIFFLIVIMKKSLCTLVSEYGKIKNRKDKDCVEIHDPYSVWSRKNTRNTIKQNLNRKFINT